MKRLIILAILHLVAAHEDNLPNVRTRSLAGKLCTKHTGQLTVQGTTISVTGDYEYWKDLPGFQSGPQRKKKAGTTKTLNTKPKPFCGEIDGKVHQLTAPRFMARKIVKKGNFTRGECDGETMDLPAYILLFVR